MSAPHPGAQHDPSQRSAQSQRSVRDKRRRRKARGAARTPEPKDIVSGAGQPLDVSVRRELEGRLGHDFGRVRLHTDRDAGALTELLGADAVAVGQDIFFRPGAYRPGTVDGQRLLAHELLHTVQNPDGLGALRAGRDLGAVSLPQQAMERAAESAAQDLVRDAGSAPREVEPSPVTPGWLRYATVDADQRRIAELDPATLVDRLANGVLRSLRGDPEDRSGRVRLQLARLAPQVQDVVLDRLELRLPSPVLNHLLDLVEETERQAPLPLEATGVPLAVPDGAEDVAQEREDALKPAKGEGKPAPRDAQDRPREGDGPPAASGDRDAAESSAAQEQAEGAERQQERSQSEQQDRDSAAQEDRDAAAQEERQQAAGSGEKKDDAGTPEGEQEESAEAQEEAPQEPERQAGEQEPRQGDAAAVAGPAAAPAGVDRSGADPGEKLRTGDDLRRSRTRGDPENEQDADDEPLGLEAEPAEQEPARDEDTAGTAGSGAGAADGGARESDTTDDPRLFQRRKRGEPRTPGISSTEGDTEPAAPQDAAGPEGSRAAADRSDEEDSESRTLQEMWEVMSGEPEPGPAGDAGALASSGSTTVDGNTQRDWAGRQPAQDGRGGDEATARQRAEEALAADGAGPAAAVDTSAGPDQLSKADEDARAQGAAAAPARESAAESRTEGSGKAETAGKGGPGGEKEPESATVAAKESKEPKESEQPKGSEGKAGEAGGRADGPQQGAPASDTAPKNQSGQGASPAPQAAPATTSAPAPAPGTATGNDRAALSAPDCRHAHAVVSAHRTTVIGEVHTHAVAIAENSLFTGVLRVARRGVGCLRFCYVPPCSRTPRRHRCQPDLVGGDEAARVRPLFTSERYGTAAYGQLAAGCAEEITRGADDGSELGAFHDLHQPQRLDSLRARLAEYTPAGTDAGIVIVN